MKKNYIAPDMLLQLVEMLPLMNGASITNVNKGDLSNPIDAGGDAKPGGSDSRRPYNVWDDEEDEQQY